MHVEHHTVTTHDGWRLQLHRGMPDIGAPSPRRPVVFVPGYGMNGWIFRYHPLEDRGVPSFMRSLLAKGLDPWSVDLRGSSTSVPTARAPRVRLADQAFVDLPAALDAVAEISGHDRVDAIGCSLGGALLYAYGGGVSSHRLRRLVTMGAPLRWERSPLTTAMQLFGPTLGAIPVRGTRRFTRLALPVASVLAPRLLSLYLNPAITRTRPARKLTLTVEDPIPDVNREIARWMRHADLVLDGLHVTASLSALEAPLLVIVGSGDGICPPEVARSVQGRTGGPVDVVEIRHPDGHPVGHADLFISDIAPDLVYPRVAEFLLG